MNLKDTEITNATATDPSLVRKLGIIGNVVQDNY